MTKDGELWRFTKLRQAKDLNNIVERDHRQTLQQNRGRCIPLTLPSTGGNPAPIRSNAISFFRVVPPHTAQDHNAGRYPNGLPGNVCTCRAN